MNILFLCTSNLNRSKTCENYFRKKYPVHQYKSAGLSYKNCAKFDTTICTHDLLYWADLIYVFEDMHIERIKDNHDNLNTIKKITNLNIPDIYKYNSLDFISIIDRKKELDSIRSIKT